jgi:hypothetical protein
MRTNLLAASSQKDVVAYFVKAMRHYSDKEILVVPFNMGNHWVTLAIFIKYDQVWYIHIQKNNLMCDLHLTIHMFLYVYGSSGTSVWTFNQVEHDR